MQTNKVKISVTWIKTTYSTVMDGAGSQRRVRYWLIGNTLTPTYCEIVDVKQTIREDELLHWCEFKKSWALCSVYGEQ